MKNTGMTVQVGAVQYKGLAVSMLSEKQSCYAQARCVQIQLES